MDFPMGGLCFRDVHREICPQITQAVKPEKYFCFGRQKKYDKSMNRTKRFTRNCAVVDTTSKQWMWRRQRQDDSGLQSAF